MIQLMLDGLPKELPDWDIHHVDARFSRDMDDLGSARLGKIALALKFALQAIKIRLTTGTELLYYVPAPVKRSAIIRDCLLLTLLRPFFPKLVCHWHAVGLAEWAGEDSGGRNLIDRLLAGYLRWIYAGHTMSMVLTDWNRDGISALSPQRVEIVYNGLPDPCPDFETRILPIREERRENLRRGEGGGFVTMGFLGHCTEEKGLFVLLEAIALANRGALAGLPRIRVVIAGEFQCEEEKKRYKSRLQEEDLCYNGKSVVTHLGFVGGAAKEEFWERCDILAFPTFYRAESFGLVAVEAMAHGITPVTSDWRMLTELMSHCKLPVSPAGDVQAFSQALRAAISRDCPKKLRQSYLDYFSDFAHLRELSRALHLVNQ